MLTASEVKGIMKKDIVSLMAKVEELESVIHHCWLHSGYSDCGSRKMTKPQKDCYLAAVESVTHRIDNPRK
jgi:hypothetical protein